LPALKSGRMGTIESPINDSKGCGGVMRIAPVGLAYNDAEKAFQIGCGCTAITHGHPTGYLSSGTLAALISMIFSGESLPDTIDESIRVLNSVNHSGDSDSTGSITGNILGALYGVDILPESWIINLELKELIEETARYLFDQYR